MDWMVPLCVVGAYATSVALHEAIQCAKAWWFCRKAAECHEIRIGIRRAYDQFADPKGPAEGKEDNNGQNQPAAEH